MAEVDVVGSAGSHEHLSLLVDVLKKKFGLPEERAVAVALRV